MEVDGRHAAGPDMPGVRGCLAALEMTWRRMGGTPQVRKCRRPGISRWARNDMEADGLPGAGLVMPEVRGFLAALEMTWGLTGEDVL